MSSKIKKKDNIFDSKRHILPNGLILDKNLHEQLRSDHVDTLVELERLRERNKVLEQTLSKFGKGDNHNDSEEVHQEPKEDASFLELTTALKSERERVQKQSKEIIQLKETLQRNNQESHLKFRELESRLQEDFTIRMRKLQQSNDELSKQTSHFRKQMEIYLTKPILTIPEPAGKDELLLSLHHYLHQLDTVKQSQIEIANEECTKDQQLLFLTQTVEQLKEENAVLQQQWSDEDTKVSELQQQTHFLSTELCTIRSQYHQLQAEHLQLQTVLEDTIWKMKHYEQQLQQISLKKEEPKSYSDSDSEYDETKQTNPRISAIVAIRNKNKNNGMITHLPASTQTDPISMEIAQTPRSQNDIDGTTDITSLRFQEFLRLKRENKELKLLLTEKNPTQNTLIQSSSSSSSHIPRSKKNQNQNNIHQQNQSTTMLRSSSTSVNFPKIY
jgi:hypothetical protein